MRFKESGRGFRGVRAVECGRDARPGSQVSGRAEGERKEGDDTWGRAVSGRTASRLAGQACQPGEGALASAGSAGGCASGAGWGRAGCWAERKKGRWFAGWAAGAW